MKPIDQARRYLEAWNIRDAKAIVNTFAPDGTYCDPSTGLIPAADLATSATVLWTGFPDLSFEIKSMADAGPGRVLAEWVMKGCNTGGFQGLPPTGKSVVVPGVDIFDIGVDGIKSVNGYFDTRSIPVQLGLQVLVQPNNLGPFSFGNSTAVQTGKKTRPGAFSLTTIWYEASQAEEISTLTQKTAAEMLKMEGFIGASFVKIAGRGVTLAAWETPEHMKQLMRGGTHAEAMRRFWANLGAAGFTSVWVPHRINPLWVRCKACNKMSDYSSDSNLCACGQTLPEGPAYF